MPPSVLSPVDVDCEVFLPAAVQLKGENPPTVLSPIDVDTAVEQLASSVRRISLEQDALFNVFRSGRITEGARRGRRSSSEGGREGERECSEEVRDGVRQDDSTSRGEKTQDKDKQTNRKSLPDDDLDLRRNRSLSEELQQMPDKPGRSTTTFNPEQETVKQPSKISRGTKNAGKGPKEKDEAKKKPALFVDIPPPEPENIEITRTNYVSDKSHPVGKESWIVSIPITRIEETAVEEDDGTNKHLDGCGVVALPSESEATSARTSVNIPIQRLDPPPEMNRPEKRTPVTEKGPRCNNDDRLNHNYFLATSSGGVHVSEEMRSEKSNKSDKMEVSEALVSKEMRRVISQLRQVKGGLETDYTEPERKGATRPELEEKEAKEACSDTDGEDYIEASGPSPESEEREAGKSANPMSPLVSQIVEIRQFIKQFRKSIGQENAFLENNQNNVLACSNKDAEEKQETSSRAKASRSCSQAQDQCDKNGLFWASPAHVKEDEEKEELNKTEKGGRQDIKSRHLILPSSPQEPPSSVILTPKRKISVTTSISRKVSVTSPDPKSNNHPTFVHLI